jgi:hypothetical protein
MSTDPDTIETRTNRDQPRKSDRDRRDDPLSFELRSVVVNYEHRPDRRTVYPRGLSSIERMSTWLTADADAFVDLESVR